tara:strand:- start:264 stop:740 length:477 start_codon:yes stop_codon:yes gene_type:complete
MKLLIILLNFLFFVNKYGISKEYNFKWYNDEKQSDIISLPDKSNFQSFTSSGIWEDNIGNYGYMKCIISVFISPNESTNLNGVCEAKDNNNKKFWTKLRRSSSGINAGVGKMTFITGTSKYFKLKDISCPYAVEWVATGGILQMRCNADKNIPELLNK